MKCVLGAAELQLPCDTTWPGALGGGRRGAWCITASCHQYTVKSTDHLVSRENHDPELPSPCLNKRTKSCRWAVVESPV